MDVMTPCECRRSREAAMTCPREPRGVLTWTPAYVSNGQAVGPMEVRATGEEWSEVLTLGNGFEDVSEGLARQHAAIRHLNFVVGADA